MLGYGITTVALFAVKVLALRVGFRQGESCRSGSAGTVELSGSDECFTDGAGTAQSATVVQGEDDNWNMAVFFASDDCNPDSIIAFSDDGCADYGGHGSFAVWDVNPENFF